jgi:hypothetical protein
VSRGLGVIQVKIKEALRFLWSKNAPTQFDGIAWYLLYNHKGGDDIWFERSARRALDGLIKRGEVVVVDGIGSPTNPRSFLCIEDLAALGGKKPRTTAEAKEIAAGAIGNKTFVAQMVYAARLNAAARSRRL